MLIKNWLFRIGPVFPNINEIRTKFWTGPIFNNPDETNNSEPKSVPRTGPGSSPDHAPISVPDSYMFPIYEFGYQCTFFVSNLRMYCPIYFNVSNLQCFQSLYHRFKRVLMSSKVQLWCSTSLVWWKYRLSCVKSSKVVNYFENNFIFSQKARTAKVRTTWIGKTSIRGRSNR